MGTLAGDHDSSHHLCSGQEGTAATRWGCFGSAVPGHTLLSAAGSCCCSAQPAPRPLLLLKDTVLLKMNGSPGGAGLQWSRHGAGGALGCLGGHPLKAGPGQLFVVLHARAGNLWLSPGLPGTPSIWDGVEGPFLRERSGVAICHPQQPAGGA